MTKKDNEKTKNGINDVNDQENEKKVNSKVEENEIENENPEILKTEEIEDDNVVPLTEEKEELTELEKLKNELEASKESFLRLNAEYQNFRRRAVAEKADIYKYANEKLLVELLPVVDNFERGFNNVDIEKDSALHEGIELIKKSLLDFLDKNGLKVIESLDNPFDHDKHHAVMTEEKEGVEASIVIEEFQKGYEMNGKVIRHSMVKVSC